MQWDVSRLIRYHRVLVPRGLRWPSPLVHRTYFWGKVWLFSSFSGFETGGRWLTAFATGANSRTESKGSSWQGESSSWRLWGGLEGDTYIYAFIYWGVMSVFPLQLWQLLLYFRSGWELRSTSHLGKYVIFPSDGFMSHMRKWNYFEIQWCCGWVKATQIAEITVLFSVSNGNAGTANMHSTPNKTCWVRVSAFHFVFFFNLFISIFLFSLFYVSNMFHTSLAWGNRSLGSL